MPSYLTLFLIKSITLGPKFFLLLKAFSLIILSAAFFAVTLSSLATLATAFKKCSFTLYFFGISPSSWYSLKILLALTSLVNAGFLSSLFLAS